MTLYQRCPITNSCEKFDSRNSVEFWSCIWRIPNSEISLNFIHFQHKRRKNLFLKAPTLITVLNSTMLVWMKNIGNQKNSRVLLLFLECAQRKSRIMPKSLYFLHKGIADLFGWNEDADLIFLKTQSGNPQRSTHCTHNMPHPVEFLQTSRDATHDISKIDFIDYSNVKQNLWQSLRQNGVETLLHNRYWLWQLCFIRRIASLQKRWNLFCKTNWPQLEQKITATCPRGICVVNQRIFCIFPNIFPCLRIKKKKNYFDISYRQRKTFPLFIVAANSDPLEML